MFAALSFSCLLVIHFHTWPTFSHYVEYLVILFHPCLLLVVVQHWMFSLFTSAVQIQFVSQLSHLWLAGSLKSAKISTHPAEFMPLFSSPAQFYSVWAPPSGNPCTAATGYQTKLDLLIVTSNLYTNHLWPQEPGSSGGAAVYGLGKVKVHPNWSLSLMMRWGDTLEPSTTTSLDFVVDLMDGHFLEAGTCGFALISLAEMEDNSVHPIMDHSPVRMSLTRCTTTGTTLLFPLCCGLYLSQCRQQWLAAGCQWTDRGPNPETLGWTTPRRRYRPEK